MKRACTTVLFAALLVSPRLIAVEPEETRFQGLAAQFIQAYCAAHPSEGVALGWHHYDGQSFVPTAAQLNSLRGEMRGFATKFAALDRSRLSPSARRDLSVIERQLGFLRLYLDVMRLPERSPMYYADRPDLSIYLKRDWKPLTDRVRDLTALLRTAPATFAAARTNLEARLPRPYVEVGLLVAEGNAAFLEKDVAAEAAKVEDVTVRGEFGVANAAALRELRAYIDWLKASRLPEVTDSFAIGRDAFRAMLQAEMIELTPEQVLEIGRRELRAEQIRFAETARQIDPTRPATEVFLAIQKDHPTEAGLIPDTRKNLEAIRQFVLDHRLVTIPSPIRAQVKETLPPFRATSFASMETPGPFETKATEAYYFVTPTEPGWSPAQKEEWLTAFNFYTTDVVSIHEAYPGHYVQFLALNASDATTVAKVFTSYAFVEGWAHYAELMVIDEGYPGPVPAANPPTDEDRRRIARYRLAQSNEALLRLARLCCAIQLHCQGMTVDEATRFFVENAYYQEKPARQEALRGTFDPGYCFYTLGKLQLLKLRRDWQAQEGERFTLQRFHDETLRHGAPPIRMLRELMLRDPAKWSEIL